MGERTGLDMAAVHAWLQAHGYSKNRRRSLRQAMDDISAMERETLIVWAEADALKAPKHG